jgi:hypothetical protein
VAARRERDSCAEIEMGQYRAKSRQLTLLATICIDATIKALGMQRIEPEIRESSIPSV